MAKYSIPCVKGKQAREIDSQALPQDVYTYFFLIGAKTVLNRMAKVVRSAYDTEAEYLAAAMEKFEENIASAMEGKVRMTGFKVGAAKGSGKVKTEARRIARELVKEQLRAANEKLSQYDAKDITEAADALIAEDPSIVAQAEANLAERAEKAKGVKIDVAKIHKNPKKVAQLAAAAAAKGEALSKTQASKPAVRPRAS